jgi:hypothetical protein
MQVLETIYGPQEAKAPQAVMPAKIGSKPKEADLVGTYLLESSTKVNIVKRNDSLYREIEGATPVALAHVKGNVYKYTNGSGLVLAFVKSEQTTGQYDFEMYHPEIPMRKGAWLPPLVINPEELKALAGHYKNDELDSQMELQYLGEAQFSVKLKQRALDASLIRANTIRVNGGYILRPQFATDGTLSGFLLNYGRVQNVFYAKMDPK